MSDLRCERCGVEKTYADANIADIHETCEITKYDAEYGPATFPSKHNWVEIE